MATENRETTLLSYVSVLSDDQLIAYAKSAAEIEEEIGRVDDEKKSTAATFQARIKDLEVKRKSLMRKVSAGEEELEGECTWEYDYKEGTVSYFLVETGVRVMTRAITKEEQQMKLFSNQKGGKSAKTEEGE